MASVTAVCETVVMWLDRDKFHEILGTKERSLESNPRPTPTT